MGWVEVKRERGGGASGRRKEGRVGGWNSEMDEGGREG